MVCPRLGPARAQVLPTECQIAVRSNWPQACMTKLFQPCKVAAAGAPLFVYPNGMHNGFRFRFEDYDNLRRHPMPEMPQGRLVS